MAKRVKTNGVHISSFPLGIVPEVPLPEVPLPEVPQVDPFSSAAILRLPYGDVIESEGPLQGLSSEPLKWALTRCDDKYAVFDVTYFGIFFGRFDVRLEDGKIREWK
jgi:hypothetical protein